MAVTYYVPRNVNQLDGSRLGPVNCNMASGATLLDRHTLGRITCTGSRMRAHQFDQVGGTDLMDLDTAWLRGHGQNLDVRMRIAWPDLINLVTYGQAMVLQLWYGSLGNYRFQLNFYGNHSVQINQVGTMRISTGQTVPAALMLDPLGRGVKRWVPLTVLRRAAGYLKVTSTRIVGLGYAYAALARRTGRYVTSTITPPPAGSVPTLVLTKPPAPAEVSPMVTGSGIVTSSSHVMSLKRGQPVYRTPGGRVATKMGADAKVEYYGRAGGGWNCVEVLTGAAYKDGIKRPTLVYVPATAGPVTKK